MRMGMVGAIICLVLAGCARDQFFEIPEGTQLAVSLQRGLRSDVVQPGDQVLAVTTTDVSSRNRILIPAGTRVRGVVTSATPASSGDPATLAIEFRHFEDAMGVAVTIATLPIRLVSKRTGTSRGRVISAGGRAGVALDGPAVSLLTSGDDIALKPGQRILLRLDHAARVNLPV